MEKSFINKLSNDVISKFCIGSVINSPACVLKELLENSLDASSCNIKIYLEKFGFNNIRIIDDGIGIYKCDLNKLCLRFNTSKICSVNDLNNIITYGFRGESLFFINSVSKLHVSSKPHDQAIAYKVDFSKRFISPSFSVNGTIVEVFDLFYNDSVFKNFFSDIAYENNKIFKVLAYVALSKFNVHFICFHDGIEIFNLPSCVDEHSKIRRIELLTGKKKLDNYVSINFFDSGFSFYGFFFFGKKRLDGIFKFFFVNDRFVNSTIIDDVLLDILNVKKISITCFSYCFHFYLDFSLYSIIFSPKKIDIIFKDYYFVYNVLYKNLMYFFSDKKNVIYNQDLVVLKSNESKYFFCMNRSLKKKYEVKNSILTILDNLNVFFTLNDKIYTIKLNSIRSRVVSKLAAYQYFKFGRLLNKQVECCELFDFDKFCIFNNFKSFLFSYGFVFDRFNGNFLVISRVPILIYNLSVNWHALLLDLNLFLKRGGDFNCNRFDLNVINIFIKNIYDKSVCNIYEIKFFYDELVRSKLCDVIWFNKNCYEIIFK